MTSPWSGSRERQADAGPGANFDDWGESDYTHAWVTLNTAHAMLHRSFRRGYYLGMASGVIATLIIGGLVLAFR